MGSRTTRSGENRNPSRPDQQLRQTRELVLGRTRAGLGSEKRKRGFCSTASRRATSPGSQPLRLHASRARSASQSPARGASARAAKPVRNSGCTAQKDVRDEFPESIRSRFRCWNLRSDGEHRDPAAVAVIETVDQMQVARAAAPRAHRELLREMRFRARRKGGCLFVPHMDPLNLFLSAK